LSRAPDAASLPLVIVGILSDTHDRVDGARAGIKLLREHGAEYFIHCGDVGSEQILDLLAGLPAAFVFGNTDWDQRGLQRYAHDRNITCLGRGGNLELGSKLFHIEHGDDPRTMRRALDGQTFDYLLQGHTHVQRDERVGKTRVINPGALHRAREKTVAVLDTEKDGLKFLVVVGAV
jgi:putative phosphoesterase